METASIRHALRGKMNSIRLSVALLNGIDPDEAIVYLEHIERQCERIVELIDELQAAVAEEELSDRAANFIPDPSPQGNYQQPGT